MTDTTTPSTVSRQQLAAQDRSLPGKVTGRLKTAITAMVWDGASRKEAAQVAGLSDHGLRQALRRAHVKRFYLSELDVLRTSERARNVFALVDVRDNSSNSMSRVQAARTLEQLTEQAESRPRGQYQQVPGLTIVIQHGPQSPRTPPTIDVEPVAVAAADRDDG
jgi:hypothetical protein